MEDKNSIGIKKIIVLVLLGILTGFGLFIELFGFINYRSYFSSGEYLNLVTYSITSLLLLYYAIKGYKIPHGNLLKYLFFLFAVSCLGGILSTASNRTTIDIVYNYMRGVVVLMTAYIAGRLDRFKQNKIMMSIIGLIMFVSSLIESLPYFGTDIIGIFICFTFFILWIDLMVVYIFRYNEHKEVGLIVKN